MKDLDDPKAVAAADPGGMLQALEDYVDDFGRSFEAAARIRLAAPAEGGHVVVAGMGGSGIGGNLLAHLLSGESPVPIVVVKDYAPPAFVGARSVVVAVSYSGATEETLTFARRAHERGARVVAVSSGGPLERFARSARAAHLPVAPGRQPRAALPELLGTLVGAARAMGLTAQELDGRSEGTLRRFHATLRPDAPERRNPAKRLARALHDKFPVWYAASPLSTVALRGRCQLNENAKMLAYHIELPEGSHNDLVPWSALRDPARHAVACLRQPDEPPEIARRFAFLERLLDRRRVPHHAFVADQPTRLGRVLQSLALVDYVSVYAALLRGVDPTPVEAIVELKRAMARRRREDALPRSAA